MAVQHALVPLHGPLQPSAFFRQPLLGGMNIRAGLNMWDVRRLNKAYLITSLDFCLYLVLVIFGFLTWAERWFYNEREPYEIPMHIYYTWQICSVGITAVVALAVLILANAVLVYAW
jgi:hypothetical protein